MVKVDVQMIKSTFAMIAGIVASAASADLELYDELAGIYIDEEGLVILTIDLDGGAELSVNNNCFVGFELGDVKQINQFDERLFHGENVVVGCADIIGSVDLEFSDHGKHGISIDVESDSGFSGFYYLTEG